MDELPREARALLMSARLADEPPPGAQERVRGRVALAVTAAIGGWPADVGKVKVAWFNSTSGKVAMACGVLALLGGSSMLFRTGTSRPLPAAQAVAPTPAVVSSRTPAPVLDTGSAAPVLEAARAAWQPAEPASLPPRRVSSRAVKPSPSTNEPSSLRAEMALLSDASNALNGNDLTRAQTLLTAHRVRYPQGHLREERTGLEVLRYCLTDAAGADVRAQAYLRRAPDGMLAARIERACGLKESR